MANTVNDALSDAVCKTAFGGNPRANQTCSHRQAVNEVLSHVPDGWIKLDGEWSHVTDDTVDPKELLDRWTDHFGASEQGSDSTTQGQA